jgi:hypothetical protein
MAAWGSTGARLYFRKPAESMISLWDASGGVSQAYAQRIAWIRPKTNAAEDNLAFTVRDTTGTPHVWVYGGRRGGGQLPNLRSSPMWLNATAVFYVEEASCGTTCGPGPSTQPTKNRFTYDTVKQVEDSSRIEQVIGAWPRPGQI